MSVHGFVWPIAALLVANLAAAADWVEVAAPGRPGGMLANGSAGGDGERTVEALVPFDGRLYPVLAPVADGPARPIVAYDPARMDMREECPTLGRRLGRLRVLDGRLYAPVAEPVGEAGGCYVSAGGGKWDWLPVTNGGAAFYDVARFDGKTFLAGRMKDQPIVAWRADGESAWRIESLNAQAARFSYKAASFLAVSNHLALLAVRDVIGDWPPLVAPRDWGAWYVLAYAKGGSPRGFLFDGPARPLPALAALAPGASLIQNPKYAAARDAAWRDGLLYLSLRETDKGPDPAGGLFAAEARDVSPQAGRTFAARRIAGLEKARDIAVAGGRCAVLLAEEGRPEAEIRVSADLESWATAFAAPLPGTAVSLAVLDNRFYLGLDNGGILQVTRP